jgi:hypothetical protein
MALLNQEKSDEEKDLTLRWYKVRNRIREDFGQRPDINAMLYLIGMNEVGIVKEEWEKEEKQNLMHVAICKLMEPAGHFRFAGLDEEGWPHYLALEAAPKISLKEQDELLKRQIVLYFEALWSDD